MMMMMMMMMALMMIMRWFYVERVVSDNVISLYGAPGGNGIRQGTVFL